MLLRARAGVGGFATVSGKMHGRIRREEFEGGGMLTLTFSNAFPPAPHLGVNSALPMSGTDFNGDRARDATIIPARTIASALLAAQVQSTAIITSSVTLAFVRAHRARGNAKYTDPISVIMLSLGARVLGVVVSIGRG